MQPYRLAPKRLISLDIAILFVTFVTRLNLPLDVTRQGMVL